LSEGRIEYDFAIALGADPERIRLHVDGAQRIALASDGDLVIKTAAGEVIEKAPVIYQEIGGKRHAVKGGYVMRGNDDIAFRLAPLTAENLSEVERNPTGRIACVALARGEGARSFSIASVEVRNIV
jgi:hypothetical protein